MALTSFSCWRQRLEERDGRRYAQTDDPNDKEVVEVGNEFGLTVDLN